MEELDVLVDNDILIKFTCFDILDHLPHMDCPPDCSRKVAVLGAARWVVGKKLAKQDARHGARALSERFSKFLQGTNSSELEPTEPELALAAEIEDMASMSGVHLDSGESQLFAISSLRRGPLVLTGDKRAVEALETILGQQAPLEGLRHNVACLEQALARLLRVLSGAELRRRVCAASDADKAASICFRCSAAVSTENFCPRGLYSYVRDLRRRAPHVLAPGLHLRLQFRRNTA